MALERWNTHFSTTVEVEVLGVPLRLAQDPASENLGTTVWDASIVLAKFFEKNIRKGEFSRPKVTGKRAIDLGSGMGLGGLAFALLGADVVLTDMAPVLPLLRRNYEANLSPAALRAASGDGARAEAAGRITVAELDWARPEHYSADGVVGPYDFVLASDCVYHEKIIRHLYRTVLALTNERSTVIVANERRSESVQAAFLDLFSASFSFKKVPAAKQAEGYRHPAIELWVLKRRKGASAANLDALEAAEAAAEAAASREEGAAAATAAAGSGPSWQEPAAAAGEADGGGGGRPVAAAGAAAPETAAAAAASGASSQEEPASSSGGGGSSGVNAPPAVAATSAALAARMVEALGVSRTPTFDERRAGSEAAKLLAGVAVPRAALSSAAAADHDAVQTSPTERK